MISYDHNYHYLIFFHFKYDYIHSNLFIIIQLAIVKELRIINLNCPICLMVVKKMWLTFYIF